MKVKVTQSCPTLCNSTDCIVHGILQAGILEWGSLSLLQGIFLTQGLNPAPALQVDSLPAEPPGKPRILNTMALLLPKLFPFFISGILNKLCEKHSNHMELNSLFCHSM